MNVFEFLERGLDKLLDKIINESESTKNHYYNVPFNLRNSKELPFARISVEELEIYEGKNTQMLHVQYFFEKGENIIDIDRIIKEKKWELLLETKERSVYMHNDEPVNLSLVSENTYPCLEVSYHVDRNKRFDKGEYSFVLIQLFNYLINIFDKREGRQDNVLETEELDFGRHDLLNIRDPQKIFDDRSEINKIYRRTQERGSNLEGDIYGIIPAEITTSKKSLVVNGCNGVVWFYERGGQIRASFPLTLDDKKKLRYIKLPHKYRVNSGSYGTTIILDKKPPLNNRERMRFERIVMTIVNKLS